MLESRGPTCRAFQNRIIQANGKEYILATLDLLVKSCVYLPFDPSTLDGVLGENELLLRMDGLFDPA